jgi:hypothetical protein
VLRDEGYRRDAGKLADQVPQRLNLFRRTPMDRHQNRVDRALSHDPDRIRNGIPVHHRKTTAAGGIDSRPFDR